MYGCCISRELTKTEKMGMLNDYRDAPEKELESVKEKIKELENK